MCKGPEGAFGADEVKRWEVSVAGGKHVKEIVGGDIGKEPPRVTFCSYFEGFPDGASGKEPICQSSRYRRCWFDPWVGKIPWRRVRQPTPVFLPGESWTEEPGGLRFIEWQRVGHN